MVWYAVDAFVSRLYDASGAVSRSRAGDDVGPAKLEGASLVPAEIRAKLRHPVQPEGVIEADQGRIRLQVCVMF